MDFKMSLYDGVDIDGVPLESDRTADGLEKTDISKLSGWSASYKLMQTQLQRKKVAQAKPTSQKSRTINQVVLDKVRKKPEQENPQEMAEAQDPFLEVDPSMVVVIDEYDPMRPNEYEEVKQRFRESRDKRMEREVDDRDRRCRDRDRDQDRDRDRDRDRPRERGRDRGRDRDRDSGSDEEEKHRAPVRRGGAAIAPPPSLIEDSPTPKSHFGEFRGDPIPERKLFHGNKQKEKPNVGFEASPVASQIMARYGWKDGQGLGKQGQGMNTCLQVEKTSKRGGKIINQEKVVDSPHVETEIVPTSMRNPSKVVVLQNMVGPGDVDGELEPEVAEECSTKYGEVVKVLIYEIPQGVPDEEAVRIFVEFTRIESATKAVIDLNGRFFGGRIVKATFYNLDRFRRLDLTAE